MAHVLAMYAARYEPAVQAVKRMLDRIAGLAKARSISGAVAARPGAARARGSSAATVAVQASKNLFFCMVLLLSGDW